MRYILNLSTPVFFLTLFYVFRSCWRPALTWAWSPSLWFRPSATWSSSLNLANSNISGTAYISTFSSSITLLYTPLFHSSLRVLIKQLSLLRSLSLFRSISLSLFLPLALSRYIFYSLSIFLSHTHTQSHNKITLFRDHQEMPESICPCHNETYPLIKDYISQVG